MDGGVESPQVADTPRVIEAPRVEKNLGATTSSQYQQGEDGWGQGGGNENPPTARTTRRQGPDGGNGTSRSKQTSALSATMETAAVDGGEDPRKEHFDSADGARTDKGMHPRHEYVNVASEATERGQASAGAAAGEDGHGATVTSTGPRRAEEGDENPRRVLPVQETYGGETEAIPPPRTVAQT